MMGPVIDAIAPDASALRSSVREAADRDGAAQSARENAALRGEVARLEARCTRHELALDALTRALRDLRKGALALRSENAELRAAVAQARVAGRRRPVRSGR